nr:energy transducer TonB [Tepidicella baoligensis]
MPPFTTRHFVVVTAVVAAHAGALWALQAGLQNRPPQEVVIPAQIVAEWVTAATPAHPAPPPAPTSAPPVAAPPPRPSPAALAPRPMSAPVSQAASSAEPLPTLPVAKTEPPAADASPATSLATPPAHSDSTVPSALSLASAPPGPPAPPRIELPSAAARYLDNPPPRYPPLSRRLGEQGQVVLRVRIEVDGTASQAEIRTSSGYARLDQAALQTVLAWRYVPGTRNGVPEAMWFNIPINFVLE